MRYQIVDCRWDLTKPGWGKEQYLAAHLPGASFMDVETDLSDVSIEGQGRHPLPSVTTHARSSTSHRGAVLFTVANRR